MTIQDKILKLEEQYGFTFHPTYRDFIIASVEMYGSERGGFDMDELVAWPGVSKASASAAAPDDEDSVEYWLSDMAELWGISNLLSEVEEGDRWSAVLMKKGYPIGVGYDGSLFVQASTGECFHTYGDEWFEAEDHAKLAKLTSAKFFKEWGHHPLADDFREFYRMLCEQRGCR